MRSKSNDFDALECETYLEYDYSDEETSVSFDFGVLIMSRGAFLLFLYLSYQDLISSRDTTIV